MSDNPTPKIKVCGMADADSIARVAELQPDFMGFIFYSKSVRYAIGRVSPTVVRNIVPSIQKVGVFVNEPVDSIRRTASDYGLSYVQLHGGESVEMCERIKGDGLGVVKVFSISSDADFAHVSDFANCADYLLFDTKTPLYGGSGTSFNWSLIPSVGLPFIISGGIGTDNIDAAVATGATVVDLNSRFELSPGVKDIGLLQSVFERIRGFKRR